MDIGNAIVAEAQRLFDVAAGISYGGDSILILGLMTTPERDLDYFLKDEDGVFRLRGFEVHAQPRLDSLVYYIGNQDLLAEVWGHCGYPRGGELNLKQQAVASGLGRWGKSSLVLHPQFGPWLRLMAVRVVAAALFSIGPDRDSRDESPLCDGCTACIDACPLGILEPYYLKERGSCRANISQSKQSGTLVLCDQCLLVCPVGQ
ncbi:hypothetical protein ACFLT4_03940 [Chloroflexota bacterium]